MLTPTSDSTNYLSLALDARKTIKALVAFSENGVQNADLQTALNDAAESLKALNSGEALFAHLKPASSYEFYEQISTLQEVQLSMKDERLPEKLEMVVNAANVDQRRDSAELALRFFVALENRALQKFSRSAGSSFTR